MCYERKEAGEIIVKKEIQEEGCDYRTRRVTRKETDDRKRRKERGRRAQEKKGKSFYSFFFPLR